ncbi:hypothetical protein D1646_04285 [Pseudoflavonifractor sp. 60]|uniref:hypothetical protein n=1 Tax=Pseudoflavonifractor sp. 60 TaxID=2304576 RepID=UPI00136E638E|nr:hypothetical protein [Pseudoflavonifractor sp. 60]NBI66041.1 hypothetical protein [Pseudoflavonifractor sp. 60]
MDNRKRRAIELAKDVLIVLLTCSALWLVAQTPLVGPLSGLFREEGIQAAPGQSQSVSRGTGAVPLAMAVNLPASSELESGEVRWGIRYDQGTCQELFQQVAGPLVEALSSAGAPEAVSRGHWERALTEMQSVYMDFQGEVPLPVLLGWLSGSETGLTASVRRIVLTVWEDGVDLYYQDVGDGRYYRCRSEVADPFSLAEALSGVTGNGAFYAFESELYQELDPDTLLLPQAPAPMIYTASNPVAGQGALQSLVQDLGFSLNSTSFYSTDEQVARSGDDSVRLSDRGVAQYLYEGRSESGLFPVISQGESGALFNSVETCRQLALSVTASRCGEARLYLLSVSERPEGWEIEFGYSLNGVPVQLEGNCAARFLVERGQIVQFVICLRSYAASGTTSLVLPPRQAAAALVAQGLEGEELLLTYDDSGEDTVTAGWSARDRED